jgi:LEA14-like dessication related protein
MTKTSKNILIALGVGTSLFVAFGYYEYLKLMQYVIRVKSIIPKRITATNINFDLFVWFKNNSDLRITIEQQNHKVYLNDKFITSIVNNVDNTIKPKETSVIGFNVDINLKELLGVLSKEYMNIILHPDKFKIRIDMNFRIKFYFIHVNIPYNYEIGINEIISMLSKKNQSI